MSSLLGKKDGYVRLDRQSESPESDDPLIDTMDNVEVTSDQATFDFRRNGDPVIPGPFAGTSRDSEITSINATAVDVHTSTAPPDPSRQVSLTTSMYGNVETEENLKCIVSSLLFVVIIVVLIVVAFVFNPPV